jgi:CheY-like chemotaxis protein
MLRSNGFAVEAFATAEALLERLPYDGIACVLIDLRMPGVSGLELQDVMSRRGLTMRTAADHLTPTPQCRAVSVPATRPEDSNGVTTCSPAHQPSVAGLESHRVSRW